MGRVFGPKMDDNGECRNLHNEEIHSLYRSPNIVRVIKSRRLRWIGNIVRVIKSRRLRWMGRKYNQEKDLVKPRQRWEAIIEWIFKK
jgi:hypothetical protein